MPGVHTMPEAGLRPTVGKVLSCPESKEVTEGFTSGSRVGRPTSFTPSVCMFGPQNAAFAAPPGDSLAQMLV